MLFVEQMDAETIFDLVPLSEWREVYRAALVAARNNTVNTADRYIAERHLCEHIIARQEQRIAELRNRVRSAQSDMEEDAEAGSRIAASGLAAMRRVERWIEELFPNNARLAQLLLAEKDKRIAELEAQVKIFDEIKFRVENRLFDYRYGGTSDYATGHDDGWDAAMSEMEKLINSSK